MTNFHAIHDIQYDPYNSSCWMGDVNMHLLISKHSLIHQKLEFVQQSGGRTLIEMRNVSIKVN